MVVRLRTSLAIFQLGFALESIGGFVVLSGAATMLPFHGLVFLLSPAFSALGIVWLWIGRHEWNELHVRRVGHASLAFQSSLLAAGLAIGVVLLLAATGPTDPPYWTRLLFGAAVAAVLALTFLTYVLVASHLVGRWGGLAMALGVGWALLLSGLIGLALVPELPPIVRSVVLKSPAVAPVLQPLTALAALFAFSYLAFFLAFTDAHWRVVQGLDPEPG